MPSVTRAIVGRAARCAINGDLGSEAERDGGTLGRGGQCGYVRAAAACKLHSKVTNPAAGPAHQTRCPAATDARSNLPTQ